MRLYGSVADRFLRISIVDEDLYPMRGDDLSPLLVQRYERVLKGFQIGGRMYRFLAHSSSQLRLGSCWLFSADGTLTGKQVIYSLGDFSGNTSVAKYGARIGQCFSTTIPTLEIDLGENSMEFEHGADIKTKDNKYTFSDGHGRIPLSYAKRISVMLDKTAVPSAYQIRIAGYKGVVSIDPNEAATKLFMRDSMCKFRHRQRINVLEIVAVSQFGAAFLNRPLITLLSHGGVSDDVLVQKLAEDIKALDRLLVDDVAAKDELGSINTQFQPLGTIVEAMLMAGFSVNKEPMLRALLSVFRTHRMYKIRTKANVSMRLRCSLMGVLDETFSLESGEVFVQINCPRTNKKRVLTGPVLVYKNPVVHPGDVRKLKAVDNPKLRYLEDCLVFPAKGKRPHSNETSGSDLDGDVYCIIYDQDIVVQFKQSEPGAHQPPKPLTKTPITDADRIEWFLRYLKEDKLGILGNAHLMHSDMSNSGPKDNCCLQLASLYCFAVDFAKTGIMPNLPKWVKVREPPDFMCKKDMHSYPSKKILGTLYRSSTKPIPEKRLPVSVDPDLVYDGYLAFLPEAEKLKAQYDRHLTSILNQFGISEIEAFSGSIVKFKNPLAKRAQQDAENAVITKVSALKTRYAKEFMVGLEHATEEVQYAKSSAWYVATYTVDSHASNENGTTYSEGRLISFCWVVWRQLSILKRLTNNKAAE